MPAMVEPTNLIWEVAQPKESRKSMSVARNTHARDCVLTLVLGGRKVKLDSLRQRREKRDAQSEESKW